MIYKGLRPTNMRFFFYSHRNTSLTKWVLLGFKFWNQFWVSLIALYKSLFFVLFFEKKIEKQKLKNKNNKKIEQRAQLTQWYKYLNYTARAIHTGWPGVTSTTKAVYWYIKDKVAQGQRVYSRRRTDSVLIPLFNRCCINILNRREVLHKLPGVKYDVSSFHEILTGNSH